MQPENSIVLGNDAGYEGKLDDFWLTAATVTSNGHNVLGGGAGMMGLDDPVGVDPALVLAGGGQLVLVNGTWVVPLRDAADNPALAAADPATAGTVDQTGAARPAPVGTTPDIGAYELSQRVVVSTTPSAGDDRIFGTNCADVVDALAGNDSVRGLDGNDLLRVASGNDLVAGGAGNDRLFGDAGDDNLDGGRGNDRLDGGVGNDALAGGEGNDNL